MGRQWENTDIRKEQIIEAALSIMMEDGFDKLSIEEMARRVGLTPSGIYRHFKGRDDVLDAVLPVFEARMRNMLVQVEQASPLAREKLHIFLQTLLANIYIKQTLPEAMLTAEYFRNGPTRKSVLLGIVKLMRCFVSEKIAEGQAVHDIAPNLDVDAFWVLLFGSVRVAMIYWTLSEENYDVEAHGHASWKMLSRLLDTGEMPD